MSVVLTQMYRDLSRPWVALVLLLPTFFTVIALMSIGISERHQLQRKLNLSNRLPIGLPVTLIALVALLLTIGVVSGPATVVRGIQLAGESFLYPIFGDTPLAKQVSELGRMTFVHWRSRYGIFFFVFILGAIVSAAKLARSYNLDWKIVAGGYTAMVAVTIISSMDTKPPLDGYTTLSNTIYLLSLLVFGGLLYLLYLRRYQHQDKPKKSSDNLILVLVWFTLTLFCTRAAVRFSIFLTPAAIILGSYALAEFLKILRADKSAEKVVGYTVVAILSWEMLAFGVAILPLVPSIRSLGWHIWFNISLGMIILSVVLGLKLLIRGKGTRHLIRGGLWLTSVCLLAVILGGWPKLAVGYANRKLSLSWPSSEWIKVFDWVKENTEKTAVLAMWWDHGNRMLALADRATIVDNEQLPYWIHLMARHVFLAQSQREALEFLYTHKATHLLINTRDIKHLHCSIAMQSGKEFDGKISIEYLRGDKSGLRFSPQAKANLPVQSVDLILDADKKPTLAILTMNSKKVELKAKCSSTTNQIYIYSTDKLPGVIVVKPQK